MLKTFWQMNFEWMWAVQSRCSIINCIVLLSPLLEEVISIIEILNILMLIFFHTLSYQHYPISLEGDSAPSHLHAVLKYQDEIPRKTVAEGNGSETAWAFSGQKRHLWANSERLLLNLLLENENNLYLYKIPRGFAILLYKVRKITARSAAPSGACTQLHLPAVTQLWNPLHHHGMSSWQCHNINKPQYISNESTS